MPSRSLRILYDHQMFALQRFGGITRIFVELARRLSARDDCEIYWHRGYHQDGYDVSDFQARLARYWSIDRRPPVIGGWPRERINRHAFRCFARTIWGGVDIYHPSYFEAGLLDIPRTGHVAVTVYDMILERFMADQPRVRAQIAGKRRLVERADLVFVISEHTRRDVVELLGVDPARTVLTYPASDLASVPAASLPQGLVERPYLLYVGPRSKYKNFPLLLETFRQSAWLRRELRVVCLGGGPFLEPEQQFLRDHALTECFTQVSGDDRILKALYERAVALAWTSHFEGFGIPPLEAMEVGCPVVCAPTSSMPEVVGDAALFFDPDRADELAERLQQIAEDTALRRRLIAGGRGRARLFSWDAMTAATLDGYRRLVH
ncbi:MAG: glycosyltransferase family 4 protein [Chloroflexi bacterium]|nr:glycosyltransferase family 4 protein [Chloroflexota bacterium]